MLSPAAGLTLPASVSVSQAVDPTPPPVRRRRLKTVLRKLRYRGERYHCPLCASNLRELKPYGFDFPVLLEQRVIGGGYRPQARCPVCKSTDRERLLYLYLWHRTDLFASPGKLLHVAPEPGLGRALRQIPGIDYLSADLAADKAMVRMDITAIDYPEGSFDVIVCNHVLEHIPDDRRAMRELHRVMRPGGWGILQVPMSLALAQTLEDPNVTTPAERERVFGQSDHVRLYAGDYVERLESCGFDVTTYRWWEDPELAGADNRFGLLADETLYRVDKRR